MIFTITARHFKAWPELQETLQTKADYFAKAHPQVTSTEVILSEEHDKEVEFIVHVNNHVLSAKDKMIAQLRKLKEKQSDYRRM